MIDLKVTFPVIYPTFTPHHFNSGFQVLLNNLTSPTILSKFYKTISPCELIILIKPRQMITLYLNIRTAKNVDKRALFVISAVTVQLLTAELQVSC